MVSDLLQCVLVIIQTRVIGLKHKYYSMSKLGKHLTSRFRGRLGSLPFRLIVIPHNFLSWSNSKRKNKLMLGLVWFKITRGAWAWSELSNIFVQLNISVFAKHNKGVELIRKVSGVKFLFLLYIPIFFSFRIRFIFLKENHLFFLVFIHGRCKIAKSKVGARNHFRIWYFANVFRCPYHQCL